MMVSFKDGRMPVPDVDLSYIQNPKGPAYTIIKEKIGKGESLEKLKMYISFMLADPPKPIRDAITQQSVGDFYVIALYFADVAFAAQLIVHEEASNIVKDHQGGG